MRSFLLFTASAVLLLFGGYALFQQTPPPILGKLPEFKVLNFDGTALSRASLAEKNWIINFFFTSCPKICPAASARLREIAEAMRGRSDFGILSVSVDPERDDLAALQAYRNRFIPKGVLWNFARADIRKVKELAQGLMVDAADAAELHTGRLILIDKLGQIRGYYRAEDSEDLDKLRKVLPGLD